MAPSSSWSCQLLSLSPTADCCLLFCMHGAAKNMAGNRKISKYGGKRYTRYGGNKENGGKQKPVEGGSDTTRAIIMIK